MTTDNVDKSNQDTQIDYPQKVDVLPPENDIPGVNPQVAQKIYESLKNGRKYFGSSGASLTWQAFNKEDNEISPALAKVGLAGERETTKILREWAKDKPGVVIVDSVHIDMSYKDSQTDVDEEEFNNEEVDPETGIQDGKDTDHIIIIGQYVILVDTKRWKPNKMYSISDKGTVLRSKKSFPGGNIRMRNAIYLWRDYLYPGTIISGFVFINTEKEGIEPPDNPDEKKTIVVRDNNWWKQPYKLVEKTKFLELLDSHIYKTIYSNDPGELGIIDSTIISQIVVSAIKPYDVRKRIFSEQAFGSFK